MPAIPIIALGVSAAGTAYGAYQQHKAGKRADAALQGAQSTADQQLGFQKEMFGAARPMLDRAGSYWGTLLGGSRNAMSQATAGPRGAITDQYRGATKSLEQSGVRGGVKDVATAELARDRAGRVAALTSGVQPGAAQGLSEIGGKFLGVAPGLGGTGASLYSSLMGATADRYNTASQSAGQSASAFGSLLFDLLKARYSGGGGGLPSTPFPGTGGYGPMPSAGG
jgi:hypothetical protein